MRPLTTIEKAGTIIRHPAAGTVAEIRGCYRGGFIVKVLEGYNVGVTLMLPFEKVNQWEIR